MLQDFEIFKIKLKNKEIREFKIDPNEIGIKFSNPENLKGKDADYNANKIIDVFSGDKNEFSEAVCLNSAAALIICNRFNKFEDAYEFSKKHLELCESLLKSIRCHDCIREFGDSIKELKELYEYESDDNKGYV